MIMRRSTTALTSSGVSCSHQLLVLQQAAMQAAWLPLVVIGEYSSEHREEHREVAPSMGQHCKNGQSSKPLL